MSDLKTHPQPCECPFCGAERKLRAESSFAAPTGLDAEQVRAAVMAEPELPGDMPDEMWEALSKDKESAAECLRIVVRQTKSGILQRLNLKASNVRHNPACVTERDVGLKPLNNPSATRRQPVDTFSDFS